MKILDTNLWVFGTLRTNERAAELLTAIERGETTSAISAYMLQEALAAFDRTKSLSAAERDSVKTAAVDAVAIADTSEEQTIDAVYSDLADWATAREERERYERARQQRAGADGEQASG